MIDPSKVRQLQISAPIPEYPFVYRKDLDSELKQSMQVAFHNLNEKSILKPLRAEGFAPIQDKDYDIIRETATILNMSLTK
jgi:phosphonate transport system substrate-binding protein